MQKLAIILKLVNIQLSYFQVKNQFVIISFEQTFPVKDLIIVQ
jgi:hypothetical protein